MLNQQSGDLLNPREAYQNAQSLVAKCKKQVQNIHKLVVNKSKQDGGDLFLKDYRKSGFLNFLKKEEELVKLEREEKVILDFINLEDAEI